MNGHLNESKVQMSKALGINGENAKVANMKGQK
jgi:hypothetical protein